MASLALQFLCQFVEVPKLAERNTEFEEAVLVQGQKCTVCRRIPGREGLRSEVFDRIVVGNQGTNTRIAEKLLQARIASIECSTHAVDLRSVR